MTGINPTSNLGANMQGIIFGVLLILTMLFAPHGIAGLGRRLRFFAKSVRRVASASTGE